MFMLKYLRIIFSCGYKLIYLYFGFIVRYARHPERYPKEVRYAKVRELFGTIFDHFRIDWKIKGIGNVRKLEKEGKTFLLVPNHLSDFDPLCILYYMEKPVTFVAKKEAKKFPFVGKVIKALDGYFLDRNDLRDGVKMIKFVQEKLLNGTSVIIYPEGTRNRAPNGSMAEFHPGSLKSLYKTGVPVIGIAQYGTQIPLQINNNYKRYPIYITFFPPIYKEEYEKYAAAEFAPMFETMIAKEVYNLRFLCDSYYLLEEEKIPLKKPI